MISYLDRINDYTSRWTCDGGWVLKFQVFGQHENALDSLWIVLTRQLQSKLLLEQKLPECDRYGRPNHLLFNALQCRPRALYGFSYGIILL